MALAFLAYAAARPAAGGSVRQLASGMVEFLADQIRSARADGAGRSIDPAAAAAGLLALTEGLGLYLLTDQYSPQRALDTLDAYLALILA